MKSTKSMALGKANSEVKSGTSLNQSKLNVYSHSTRLIIIFSCAKKYTLKRGSNLAFSGGNDGNE